MVGWCAALPQFDFNRQQQNPFNFNQQQQQQQQNPFNFNQQQPNFNNFNQQQPQLGANQQQQQFDFGQNNFIQPQTSQPPQQPQPPQQSQSPQQPQPPAAASPMLDRAFYRCFDSCPTLSQYNPVCGSDGLNYHNDQKLRCHNECGRRSGTNWSGESKRNQSRVLYCRGAQIQFSFYYRSVTRAHGNLPATWMSQKYGCSFMD